MVKYQVCMLGDSDHVKEGTYNILLCAAVKQQTLRGSAFTALLLDIKPAATQAVNKNLFFNTLPNETILKKQEE